MLTIKPFPILAAVLATFATSALAQSDNHGNGARPVPQGLLPALAGARRPERLLLQRPDRSRRSRNGRLRADKSGRPQRPLGGMGQANWSLAKDSRREDHQAAQPKRFRRSSLLDTVARHDLFRAAGHGRLTKG